MTKQQNNSLHEDRERKGAFFTPKIWGELSQRYIADATTKGKMNNKSKDETCMQLMRFFAEFPR